MDPHALTAPFQSTKSMRREIYPAIDPKNPELSAANKTILITGATGGIGGEVARAWANAGAKGIALVGRTFPGMSAYSGSKLALMKLAEFLDAEKPDLRVFTVHPGIVAVTETHRGMVVDALTPFAKDKGIQTGGLSLYLARRELTTSEVALSASAGTLQRWKLMQRKSKKRSS
ncbi:hypothetical protein E8E11_009730 [Didymella keratinophila]|nr:hypothetical protein E8E11_009730 [Didymella keratinophila]